MSTILRIESPAGRQEFSVQDFPIAVAVGAQDGEAAIFGQAAESRPVAWLGQKGGDVFIEPSSEARLVRLNGRRLEDSAWVVAGDTITIGQSSVAVLKQGGIVTLSAVGRKSTGAILGLDTSGHERAGHEAAFAEGAASPATRIGPIRQRRTRAFKAVVAVFIVLVVGVIFVSAASPVRLIVSPEPDSVSLRGLLPVMPFAASYLVLPGRYSVVAEKRGFRRLEQQITVAFGSELVA